MKKMMRQITLWLMVIGLVLSATGCAGPEGNEGEVTITVSQWHTAEEQFKQPFAELVAAFEKENPGIKVEVESIPWSDTLDQLTIRANSGTAPDLMLLCSDWVAPLAAMGALADLNTLVSDETVQALSWSKESLLNPYTVEGSLYGLTWYTFTFPLLYNKNALAQVGLTENDIPDDWGSFENQLKEIAAAGNNVYAFTRDFTQGADGGRTFIPWLWAYSGDIFDEDGNVCYDDARGVQALTAMVEVAKAGQPYPIGVGQYAAREVFAQNKICYMQESSWMRAILQDLSGEGEAYDNQWGTAPWPKSSATGNRDTLIDAHVWGVSADSEHPEEAMKFAEFLVTNREAQELFLSIFGAITPVQEYFDFEMYQDPYYSTFVEAMSESRALPFHPQINAILTDISVAMLDALNGGDPAEALRKSANTTRSMLGQSVVE